MPNLKSPLGNASYVNHLNKVKVLDVIRRARAISRAEIVRATGLSAPTVTRVVESLISEERLVRETGPGASKDIRAGRRPSIVEFSGTDNAVIGLDVGATSIRGILCDLNMQVLCRRELPTQVDRGVETILDSIARIVHEMLAEAVSLEKRVHGVGIAVAGLVDRQSGVVVFSPDFGWEDAPVYAALTERLDCPLIIDNVNRVMALGELWHGVGKRFKNFVCVNVGYGIGSGIILNGEPVYGNRGLAGEFGHIPMEKDSRVRCKCGNYGCLEALASGRAIALAAQQELGAGATSSLTDRCQGEIRAINTEMVAEAAKAGDDLARHVFENAAVYLGIGLAGLINLLSPEAVVIGGGVAEAGDVLFDTVRETVQRRTMKGHATGVEIGKVTFGLDATVIGAASLILNEVMRLKTVGRGRGKKSVSLAPF